MDPLKLFAQEGHNANYVNIAWDNFWLLALAAALWFFGGA
jgi:hypothetical protein